MKCVATQTELSLVASTCTSDISVGNQINFGQFEPPHNETGSGTSSKLLNVEIICKQQPLTLAKRTIKAT